MLYNIVLVCSVHKMNKLYRRPNQSLLKEMSTEYSLEELMLKPKPQYFGHLMWRTDSLEKTLMLGKTEGRRRDYRGWDGWMESPTWWTWVWTRSRSWWWTGKPDVLQCMGSQSRTWLRDWTELIYISPPSWNSPLHMF